MTEARLAAKDLAATTWASATDQQQAIIKFGMTPIEMVQTTEYAIARESHGADFGRLFAVALMEQADTEA